MHPAGSHLYTGGSPTGVYPRDPLPCALYTTFKTIMYVVLPSINTCTSINLDLSHACKYNMYTDRQAVSVTLYIT